MIVTKRFVFIHLHKTGGQSLSDIIQHCFPDHETIGYPLSPFCAASRT